MPTIEMYSSSLCGFCHAAKALLRAKGVEFTEINVDARADLRQQMEQRSGRRTVPQIFIADQAIGGFDELCKLDQNGELNRLLK